MAFSPPPNAIGQRRTPVQIQALTETVDALGDAVPSWATVCTLFCLRRAMTGSELTNAMQTKAVVSFVLDTLHPRSLVTVTPAHRVLYNGATYGIAWVNDVDDKQETLLIYATGQALPAG